MAYIGFPNRIRVVLSLYWRQDRAVSLGLNPWTEIILSKSTGTPSYYESNFGLSNSYSENGTHIVNNETNRILVGFRSGSYNYAYWLLPNAHGNEWSANPIQFAKGPVPGSNYNFGSLFNENIWAGGGAQAYFVRFQDDVNPTYQNHFTSYEAVAREINVKLGSTIIADGSTSPVLFYKNETKVFTIENLGSESLTISNVTASGGFSVDKTSFVIPSYSSTTLSITSANLLTTEDGDIEIISDTGIASEQTFAINCQRVATITETTLAVAQPSNEAGHLIGQIVTLTGSKKVSKLSLSFNLVQDIFRQYFTENDGVFCFDAANFQESRHSWSFQPCVYPSFNTNNTPITNSLQETTYLNSEIFDNAPYLKYTMYFSQAETYNLWCYGYANGQGIAWTWDNDSTDIRTATLGLVTPIPYWTRLATISVEEAGLHTLSIFLINKSNTVILDEIVLISTNNTVDDETLPSIFDSHIDPYSTMSDGPFSMAVRLRSLSGGSPQDLSNPATISNTAWLSSIKMPASGKGNFIFQDSEYDKGITFANGLSIEYWQIGGSSANLAAWDYSFISDSTSVGNTYSSSDFGDSIVLD
jgi:hypothetical protein